jgi:hypothetical protein
MPALYKKTPLFNDWTNYARPLLLWLKAQLGLCIGWVLVWYWIRAWLIQYTKDPAVGSRLLAELNRPRCRQYRVYAKRPRCTHVRGIHFYYTRRHHSQPFCCYRTTPCGLGVLSHNQDSVTLYHTIQHFSTLFSQLPLTVDTLAHGGVIYFTLFHTIDHPITLSAYGSGFA